jgi:hypothetical protein
MGKSKGTKKAFENNNSFLSFLTDISETSPEVKEFTGVSDESGLVIFPSIP